MREFYLISKCIGKEKGSTIKYQFNASFAGFGTKVKKVILESGEKLDVGEDYLIYAEASLDMMILKGKVLSSKKINEFKSDIF